MYLQSFDLSHNQPQGSIPSKGVFSNKSAVFLSGNLHLCGGAAEFHFHLPNCRTDNVIAEVSPLEQKYKLYTYFDINNSTSNFRDGVLMDGTVAAIKVFNLERQGASKSIIAECEALCNVRHRNLVRII
ncbi:hypothetical protein RDABS01_017365 [Bienertia sinuspersici]